ncbi:MAG: MOSC domain-containing protein [Clostridiales bacterium]|nr:MOSC domain-containing protein [Clostridiales bacterium]
MAKVIAVNISEKKGVAKHPVDKATLVENFGVLGDAHAGPGIRQVSLLGIESINKMKEYGLDGLCTGKFAENITTEGIELFKLSVGNKLKIGETLHEVSQIGKKCHAHEGCEISKKIGICVMPKEGIFTIVLKGGEIKPGDEIEIVKE